MFTIHHVLVFISYLCARNVQCWAIITKSDMGIQRYNKLKIVLAEKERTGTWLSEKMGYSISTVSRRMTNCSALCDACQSKKGQPSVEPLGLWTHATNGTQELYEIACHLDVDVKELLVSSK